MIHRLQHIVKTAQTNSLLRILKVRMTRQEYRLRLRRIRANPLLQLQAISAWHFNIRYHDVDTMIRQNLLRFTYIQRLKNVPYRECFPVNPYRYPFDRDLLVIDNQ
ncbi:hypothetical protein D3C86_1798560 [compost metagenome]